MYKRQHEYLSRAIDPFPFVTPVVLAPSGAIRQESAFSGLEMVGDEYEYVVLHDLSLIHISRLVASLRPASAARATPMLASPLS